MVFKVDSPVLKPAMCADVRITEVKAPRSKQNNDSDLNLGLSWWLSQPTVAAAQIDVSFSECILPGARTDLRAPALHSVSNTLSANHMPPHTPTSAWFMYTLCLVVHSPMPSSLVQNDPLKKRRRKKDVENFKLGGEEAEAHFPAAFSSSFLEERVHHCLPCGRSAFPLGWSEATLCAAWLTLCDTLQLWTRPDAQRGPQVTVALNNRSRGLLEALVSRVKASASNPLPARTIKSVHPLVYKAMFSTFTFAVNY